MRFLILLFSILSSSLFAQEVHIDQSKSDTTILHTFIQDLSNPNIAVDIIISQQIVVENPSDELYDYLEVSLEEIRINLLYKNISDIVYTPFLKAARKETKDIDLGTIDPQKVYLLFYKNRQVLALYLEDEKIASFTLVANGKGKAEFVLY